MATKAIPSSVRQYMSKIGKRGGRSKSEKKLSAIRENSKAGGWSRYWQKRNAAKQAI
jgi:hypothetical protein